MLVLRPADAAETSVAYKMAMENTHTPTALILSAVRHHYHVGRAFRRYHCVSAAFGAECGLIAGASGGSRKVFDVLARQYVPR